MTNNNTTNKFVTIVVLNDGETYTDISGCKILIVPEEEYYRISSEGGDANDFTAIAEIPLG
jgi:hypothetical protein